MRHEAEVTAISWIPSEAIAGLGVKLPFEVGIAHYDAPLPDVIDDLEALRAGDRFRFANHLRAYIEVEDGRITGAGHLGGGLVGSTTLKVGSRSATFAAAPFPDIQREPEIGESSARFVQTAGGRTGVPAPRRVNRKPFVQVSAPTAWSTLALTIHADGTSEFEMLGASPFPRHWIYDAGGRLAAKTGTIDFKEWWRTAFGENTPWGDEDSPAFVTAVESALERELSRVVMTGRKSKTRKVKEGALLTEQGQAGNELYLLLDGVLRAEVDGEPLAEMGPGALLGERAVLEGGLRTATLRAVTSCRVAIAAADDIDRSKLEELAAGHRREEHA